MKETLLNKKFFSRAAVFTCLFLTLTTCEQAIGGGGRARLVPVTGISGVLPLTILSGKRVDLNTYVTVEPEDATNKTIRWSVLSPEKFGLTGNDVEDGVFTPVGNGTMAITLTITGGLGGQDFVKRYGITVADNAPAVPSLSWTKAPDVTTQMPNEIQTICYGNGRFVAGSRENDGRIAYSTDGINWTGLDGDQTTFETNFTHVRFLNGKFWAVGGSGHMAWSDNGETWTAVSNPGITLNIVDIAWGEVPGKAQGVFVAGGDAGTMSYSVDGGVTWIPNNQTAYFCNNGARANFKTMTWAAGKFLAAGQLCRTIYSTDGINWKNISDTVAQKVFGEKAAPDSGTGYYGISVTAYGAGLYIVATQGRLGLSADCETWEAVDLTDVGFPRGHRWGWVNSFIYLEAEGLFILGGGDGNSAYSADARNWRPVTGNNGTNPIFHNFHFINGLAYGNGKLVGVGATCTDPNCPNDPKSGDPNHHKGDAGCVAYTTLK